MSDLAPWQQSIEGRLAALERDSHPPIDLTPAMDELLDARGYVPTVTEPALSPSARLAALLNEAAGEFERERKSMISNYADNNAGGQPRDVETIEERWAYDQVMRFGRLAQGLRAAAAELQGEAP